MTDREVMRQALLALEGWDNYGKWAWPDTALEQSKRNTTESLASLRAALEQQAEPVAWAVYDAKHGGSKTLHWPEQHSPHGDPEHFNAVPLYASPPQRKPLTEKEASALIMQDNRMENEFSSALEMIRRVEQSHGIGEKP